MLNVGLIGIGNCGNQLAAKASLELGIDSLALNSCDDDLATLPDKVIKKRIGNGDGSGKNRDEAKKYLKEKIMELTRDEELIGFLKGKDAVFIASSTGGGTGSGISVLLYEIFSKTFANKDKSKKPFVLIGVLPKLTEGLSTQANAQEYLSEVKNHPNITYMLFDNEARASEKNACMVLDAVNQDVINSIRILRGEYNISTVYDSMDTNDMKALLTTPGRISAYGILDMKEKDLDRMTIEEKLIEEMKTSSQVELERDGHVHGTGLITNLSEKLNMTMDTHIPMIRDFVGEPVEEFLHIGINKEAALPNNTFIILAGLSPIVDRYNKLKEVIDEKRAKRPDEVSEIDISVDEISELKELTNDVEEPDMSTEVDLSAIFADFNA